MDTQSEWASETLTIIPARSGSKRLPGKNLRHVEGVSLVGRAVQAALAAEFVGRVVVSTDDPRIAAEALAYGAEVPFLRDPFLAADDTSSIAVVLDVIARLGEPVWVVLVQPTSPLRTGHDIDAAIRTCRVVGAKSCVTTTGQQAHDPLLKTAEVRSPKPNGAVYVANVEWLKKSQTFFTAETTMYEMPYARSIDVDTMDDLNEARKIAKLGRNTR